MNSCSKLLIISLGKGDELGSLKLCQGTHELSAKHIEGGLYRAATLGSVYLVGLQAMTDGKRKHSSDDVIPSKLLSVVVTGRNDNYMGNFKYRITTCLNYLARNLKDLGRLDDVEVMVTDWNSDVPLAKVLPLSPEAGRICRFVYVPPAVALTLQQPGEVFYPTCAMNTSLRRGQGEFLMMFDADSLIPRRSLRVLLDLLNGKLAVPVRLDRVFFFCSRHDVPWEVVQREPSLEDWDRYLLLSSGQLPRASGSLSGLGVSGAAQMMHRSIWHACHGYNQQLRIQGWLDAELTLRVTQYYPWVDLSSIGVSLFHMEHWPRNRRVPGGQAHNPPLVNSTFVVNDENWGLGDYELDIQTAENICEPPRATEPSGTVNLIAPWNKTRGEILAGLTSQPVLKHVQRITRRWKVAPAEWGSLYALAWYSLYHYPRSYLEFGIRNGYAAAIVAAACPGVEIYGIDSWQASDSLRPVPPPDYVTGILQSVGYQGYTRLVSGKPRTAFSRLRDSSVGPLSLDLALVHGDMFGPDAIQQLSDLVPHLAPGGALVFTCTSKAAFETVWSGMRKKFPQFTYWECKSRNTGLALAVSLQKDNAGKPSDAEEIVLAAAWRDLKLNRWTSSLSFWQKRFRRIWDQLWDEPIRRWPEVLWLWWMEWQRRQRWIRASAENTNDQ